MRATLMYSGSVLLYRLMNQMSLLASSMKVLAAPYCSTSTSMLLAETEGIKRGGLGLRKKRAKEARSLLRGLFSKSQRDL